MKRLFTFYLLLLPLLMHAQLFDEISVGIGPKMERFQTSSQIIQPRPTIDAGVGIFGIKEIREDLDIRVGVSKRDVSFNYEAIIMDPVTEQVEQYFRKGVHPLYVSYQWSAQLFYKKMLSNRTAFYIGSGMQFYLNKKNSSEGARSETEFLVNEQDEIISQLKLTTYKHDIGPGNFFIRSDLGLVRALSDFLYLDLSLSHYFSSLQHYSVNFVVEDGLGFQREDIAVKYKGGGFGLNVGIRVPLNKDR